MRSTKRRAGTRVIVVADGQVLLQRDRDPGLPDATWWTTPGGGLDDGESVLAAAARELWEETGLRVEERELRGPVATRTVRHGYSDRVLIQHETFFRVDVAPFEPQPVGLTEKEKMRKIAQAWFPVEALPEVVWPAMLGELLEWDGGPAIELGEMDESTVP